jgi:SAM-dependent methyltransferase
MESIPAAGGPRLSFDRLAAIFDDQRALPPPAIAALLRAFGELANSGLRTLVEPGAGTGRVAFPALAAGLRVTALDISAPMLAELRERLTALPELAGRCEIVAGEATALPFEDEAFDAGILAQVLYLIPDWERALDELARVVRPGGVAMLLQERTAMSPALARWDAAWREATEAAGHVAIPQLPDDATAVTALAERALDVTERALATWTFGQTVGEALAGLDRMRPLYAALSDHAWSSALVRFRAWHESSGLADDARLDGTVTLTLVTGTIPANT